MFLCYFSAFLHEMAHTFTAFLIGIEPSYIAFFPFGVNLRVKSKIIYSISDEILLYMSGPLLSAVLALLSQTFFKNSYFYYNNLGLFLFNILPILPLDGGMVLKRILSEKIGNRHAERALKFNSVILIIALILFEVWLVIRNRYNFSLIFVIVFLIANIFTNNEKYSINFVKELLYIREKQKKNCVKAEVFVVHNHYSERKIVQNFSPTKSYIVVKKDANGKIIEILTEEAIIDKVLSKKG